MGPILLLVLCSQPPQQAGWIVHVRSGHQGGFAAPVGINQLLTVAHLAGSGQLEWSDESGNSGTARLLWRDDSRDLAMFMAHEPSVPQWRIIPISKSAPKNLEVLFWKVSLPGRRDYLLHGWVVGEDSDGDLWLDGRVAPGSSGSPAVNCAGELSAVVQASYNPYSASALREYRDQAQIEELINRSAFSPFSIAIPVFGGFPKPRRK